MTYSTVDISISSVRTSSVDTASTSSLSSCFPKSTRSFLSMSNSFCVEFEYCWL